MPKLKEPSTIQTTRLPTLLMSMTMARNFKFFSFAFLRGLSQIMLQENAATGLVFLIAIALGSPSLLLGTVIGAFVGTLVARHLHLDKIKINQGLFGYNAALVGMATFFFYDITIASMLLLLFGSILSCHILNGTFKLGINLPVYTAPFVISTWFILLLAPYLDLTLVINDATPSHDINLLNAISGVGQVMFQENVLVSLLFVIALAFHSIRAAIWALLASGLSVLFALSFGFPESLITLGLYGYNAVLVAIVLSAKFGFNLIPTLLGIIISVLITRGFQLMEVPALTAPFVLTCWLINGTSFFWHQKNVKSAPL
jgi:urea transporter